MHVQLKIHVLLNKELLLDLDKIAHTFSCSLLRVQTNHKFSTTNSSHMVQNVEHFTC